MSFKLVKNRRISNTSVSYDIKPHHERMISPIFVNEGNSKYIKTFINSYNSSPNKSFQMIDSISYNNKYISINDYTHILIITILLVQKENIKQLKYIHLKKEQIQESFIQSKIMNRISRILTFYK